MDPLELFQRGSDWTASKIPKATDQLEAKTPCEDWQVRDLLNHMLETQQFFTSTARGEEASPPSANPPSLIGDDPVADFEQSRKELLSAFGKPGVVEKTGPSLGIAFCDTLIHGADLARATGQDDVMPDDLAQAAFSMLDGRLTDDQRGDAFKSAVDVTTDASAQEKLLAYTGRQP
jgi:uncharacterized protein (TIGR03086 family)